MATASPTPPRTSKGHGSLRLLLPATYLALMLLSIGSFIVWTGLRLQAAALAQAGNDLELQARLIANGLQEPLEHWVEAEAEADEGDGYIPSIQSEGGEEDEGPEGGRWALPPDPTLVRLVAAAAQNTGGRITLADARQSVVYSSDPAIPLYRTDNTIEFPPDGQVRRAIRQDEWTQAERLFVTLPLFKDGQTLSGYVQLSVPTAPLYARIHQTWINLLTAGLVVLLLTALVSLGMARFILRPIQALTRVAGAIAGGDLAQQVTPAGPDEVRRLALAFNQMVGQVRETLAHQKAFVAHAAHELRTPLTGLRLRLEMLQAHGQSDPALTQRYLTQMEEEIAHLNRLAEHLLTLAALDARALPPPVPLDLAPLLYALADEMGTQARQARLALQVDVPVHLPPVAVNADSMRAALRNLLDNAIQYTPAGGQVTLRAVGEAHEVRITIVDTGIGIPPEAIGHVFERFYRVDKARSRKLGGAGLGLPLVQGIVETYGGRVEMQSTVGRGSVFTVHLPRMRDP